MAFRAVGRMLSLDLARELEVRTGRPTEEALLCLRPTQGSHEKVAEGVGRRVTSVKLYSTVDSAEDAGESP